MSDIFTQNIERIVDERINGLSKVISRLEANQHTLTHEEKQALKDEVVGELKNNIHLGLDDETIWDKVKARVATDGDVRHTTLIQLINQSEARTKLYTREELKKLPSPNSTRTEKLEVHHYRKTEKKGEGERLEVEIDKVDLTKQHKNFLELQEWMNLRCNVYLFGPTGTGKTKTAMFIANNIMKCPVHSVTLGPQTPTSKIKGYMDAQGRYVKGAAYDIYKDGGLFIINELDNGNSSVNVEFNELQDDECFFPCGKVKRHEQFFMIATANTIGNGANRSYVGRAPQDKALLNRFVFLEWPYDFELERQLGWKAYCEHGGESQEDYLKALHSFWKLRTAAENLKLDVIYSSRNLIDQLARAVAKKMNPVKITKAVFARGMEADHYRKLVAAANSLNIKDILKTEQGDENPTSEVALAVNPFEGRARTAFQKAAAADSSSLYQ